MFVPNDLRPDTVEALLDTEGLASERKRNARKAFWLKWAYSTLSLGLVAVAVSALILTAEGANVLWAG